MIRKTKFKRLLCGIILATLYCL
ncbi:MAG: hypothetical protein EU541_02600 [Promethearchaeota archaeon]|nr:MAG: hypothetical protein EU541_02600 [Candidatus Lokiarchaeota archaeon]